MRNKVQHLVEKYAEIKNLRHDLYKGHTMSGDYGWIMRPFGKNEIYLGKNLKEASENITGLIDYEMGKHEN